MSRRIAALAAALTVAVTACSSADPAALTNGSPAGGTSDAEIGVPAGSAGDFGVQVLNNGSVPVTLESVQLAPVPGFRAPRLVHAGVLAEHKLWIGEATGWPVRNPAGPGYLLVRPVRGYVVRPWARVTTAAGNKAASGS